MKKNVGRKLVGIKHYQMREYADCMTICMKVMTWLKILVFMRYYLMWWCYDFVKVYMKKKKLIN